MAPYQTGSNASATSTRKWSVFIRGHMYVCLGKHSWTHSSFQLTLSTAAWLVTKEVKSHLTPLCMQFSCHQSDYVTSSDTTSKPALPPAGDINSCFPTHILLEWFKRFITVSFGIFLEYVPSTIAFFIYSLVFMINEFIWMMIMSKYIRRVPLIWSLQAWLSGMIRLKTPSLLSSRLVILRRRYPSLAHFFLYIGWQKSLKFSMRMYFIAYHTSA